MVAKMIGNILRSVSLLSRPVGKRCFANTAVLHKELPQVSDISIIFLIFHISHQLKDRVFLYPVRVNQIQY